MKKEFEEIDQLIKQALSEEEASFYDQLEEQNFISMFGGVFRGKNKWMIVLMNIMVFVALGFLIYCMIHFFKAEETNTLIQWGMGAVICLLMMSMIKIFMWMQMDKNSVIREIKRMEIQISALSSKLSE